MQLFKGSYCSQGTFRGLKVAVHTNAEELTRGTYILKQRFLSEATELYKVKMVKIGKGRGFMGIQNTGEES